MLEIWRHIPGWPYAVSSLGAVKRTAGGRATRPGRLLRPTVNKKGYEMVDLRQPGRRWGVGVHQLVCRAFKGPPPTPGHQVAHKDGKQRRNIATNLRWRTLGDNNRDKQRHGTQTCGEAHPRAILTETIVRQIRRRVANGESQSAVARLLGVSHNSVWWVVHRKTWKHVA